MSTDALISVLRALVARGEYLDTIPGKPDVALEGGGAFIVKDGVERRLFSRRTPEYADARARGWIEPLPPLPLAATRDIEQAEATLGFAFDPLLRRLLTEVGNGGFGPGYGMLGLGAGHRDDLRNNVLDAWASFDLERRTLLPLCTWGCAIYSFVDCADGGQIWGWDPNPVDDDTLPLFRQECRLTEWLERWIDGRLYQPTIIRDESTGEWRGATDEELAVMLEEC